MVLANQIGEKTLLHMVFFFKIRWIFIVCVWGAGVVVRSYDRAEPGSAPLHPTQISWITSLTHFFVAQRAQRTVGHAGKL